MMDVHLHRVCIRLECAAQAVQRYWQRLFAGWLGDCDLGTLAHFHLALVEERPLLPDGLPFFVDASVGRLSVYRQGLDGVLLHYLDGALVDVPLRGERPFLSGHILAKAVNSGRLEDITFTSLAPFLRRHGYYLVHAFGVCRDGRCCLFVGPSGSGKTTTGLSLVLAGWELLANDVLMIEERPDGVYVLPTPGGLSIREGTLGLLPDCQQLLADVPYVQGKYDLTNQQVWNGRIPEAVRVTALYFCQIEEREVSERRPLSQAIALTQLMEQSIDRWDTEMFDQHITVLQKLSQQADCFTLHLGRDVPQLPDFLADKV